MPHRINRNKEELMRMDSGVSRFCSSFSSRIMRHKACVYEGANCDGQCSLQHNRAEHHVRESCMGVAGAL
eukprot:8335556-Pyramimonas_sp.AAC.1